jgi:hypothetical protein
LATYETEIIYYHVIVRVERSGFGRMQRFKHRLLGSHDPAGHERACGPGDSASNKLTGSSPQQCGNASGGPADCADASGFSIGREPGLQGSGALAVWPGDCWSLDFRLKTANLPHEIAWLPASDAIDGGIGSRGLRK